MEKKYKIIIFALLISVLAIANSEILPTRTEITEIDIANVIGFDVYKEDYEMTILRTNSKNKTGNNIDQSSSLKEETISTKGVSYVNDLMTIQDVSNKHLTTSHTNYYLIGEKSINTDLKHIIDFLARSYQTRLNANVYVAKGCTAKEFLQKVSKEDFVLSEKLENIEKDIDSQTITKITNITDVVNILLKKEMDGVLPVLLFVNKETDDLSANENNINYKAPFAYDGLIVIKDAKVVGYLNKEETESYNYILKGVDDFHLYLKDKQVEICFGIKNMKTNIKFDISKEKEIQKIIFKTEFKSSFEEVKASIDVFSKQNTNRYEKMQEEIVKKRIEKIIAISKDLNVDFLELERQLKINNPYKYVKMKGDIWEKIKNADIEVIVDSNLKTTFDIIETNKGQIDK